MKKILLSSVALLGLTAGAMAADLPARRVAPVAPVVAVPMFTWSGFYVGGQVGYQFGDNDYNYDRVYADAAYRALFGTTVYGFDNGDDDGFVAGAHVGYNFQFGAFVVGVEGDIEGVFGDDDHDYGYAALTAAQRDFLNANGLYGHGGLDWQGSVRARLGFAFDRVLVYGTAGVAFGGYGGGNYYGATYYGGSDTATGWTAGVGVEYAFTNNLTARVEYRYTSLDRGGDNYWLAGTALHDYARSNDDDFHTVRVGVSYKF